VLLVVVMIYGPRGLLAGLIDVYRRFVPARKESAA
jgi:hypothetical protein